MSYSACYWAEMSTPTQAPAQVDPLNILVVNATELSEWALVSPVTDVVHGFTKIVSICRL